MAAESSTGMPSIPIESSLSSLIPCPRGSRFDYLRQEHFHVLQDRPTTRFHHARRFSGPFFGNFRCCPHTQHHNRDRCTITAQCPRCTEIQQKRDTIQCTSLFLELMEAVRVVECSDENFFGFKVGAKANPLNHELPWIENVSQNMPSSAKLKIRERIVTVNGNSVSGMSAREVKALVLAARFKLHLEVFGEKEDESGVRSEILYRGRLGRLHDLAETWCRKVDNSSCEFSAKAIQACKDIQSALKTFITLLNELDEAEQIFEALGQRASIAKGPLLHPSAPQSCPPLDPSAPNLRPRAASRGRC